MARVLVGPSPVSLHSPLLRSCWAAGQHGLILQAAASLSGQLSLQELRDFTYRKRRHLTPHGEQKAQLSALSPKSPSTVAPESKPEDLGFCALGFSQLAKRLTPPLLPQPRQCG